MSQNNDRDLNLRTLGSLTISILAHAGLLALLMMSPKILDIGNSKGNNGKGGSVAYVDTTPAASAPSASPSAGDSAAPTEAPTKAPTEAPAKASTDAAKDDSKNAAPEPQLNASPSADDVAVKAPSKSEPAAALPVKQVERKVIAQPAEKAEAPAPKVKTAKIKKSKIKTAKVSSKSLPEKSALPEALSAELETPEIKTPEIKTTETSEVAIKKAVKVESFETNAEAKQEKFLPLKNRAAPTKSDSTPEPIVAADAEVKAIDNANAESEKQADDAAAKEIEALKTDAKSEEKTNAKSDSKSEAVAVPEITEAPKSVTPNTTPEEKIEEPVVDAKPAPKAETPVAQESPKSSDDDYLAANPALLEKFEGKSEEKSEEKSESKSEPKAEVKAEPVAETKPEVKTEAEASPSASPVATEISDSDLISGSASGSTTSEKDSGKAEEKSSGDGASKSTVTSPFAKPGANSSPEASGDGNVQNDNQSGGQGPEALGIPAGAEIRDASRLTPAPGNQSFAYPQQDRLHGRTGTATVVGRVESDGSVTQVALEKSSGSKTMDQEALSTFRKWKFMPGQEGYVRKPVQFVLKGEAQVSKSKLGR